MFESERQTFASGHSQLSRYILNFIDSVENQIKALRDKHVELETEIQRLKDKYEPQNSKNKKDTSSGL